LPKLDGVEALDQAIVLVLNLRDFVLHRGQPLVDAVQAAAAAPQQGHAERAAEHQSFRFELHRPPIVEFGSRFGQTSDGRRGVRAPGFGAGHRQILIKF
jgi:hypothetical protein